MVQSTFYFSIQVASQTSKLNISIPVAHNVNKSVSQESVGQECQVIRQIVYGISLRWFTDSFHCLFNFLLLSSLNTKTCNENLTKCIAYLSVLSAMKSWFPCTMISLHHDFLAPWFPCTENWEWPETINNAWFLYPYHETFEVEDQFSVHKYLYQVP